MKLLIIWKDIVKIPNAKVIICETYSCKDHITFTVVSWSFSRFNIHPASLKIQCAPRKFLSKTQSQTPTQVKSKTDTTSKHKRKTTSSKPTKTKLLSIAPNPPKVGYMSPKLPIFKGLTKILLTLELLVISNVWNSKFVNLTVYTALPVFFSEFWESNTRHFESFFNRSKIWKFTTSHNHKASFQLGSGDGDLFFGLEGALRKLHVRNN